MANEHGRKAVRSSFRTNDSATLPMHPPPILGEIDFIIHVRTHLRPLQLCLASPPTLCLSGEKCILIIYTVSRNGRPHAWLMKYMDLPLNTAQACPLAAAMSTNLQRDSDVAGTTI